VVKAVGGETGEKEAITPILAFNVECHAPIVREKTSAIQIVRYYKDERHTSNRVMRIASNWFVLMFQMSCFNC